MPIGILAAAFEYNHLQSMRETEAREAAEKAAGHVPPRRATASHGGTTSHGVAVDPSNPLHKLLPDTDCEYCLETREKLWGMVKQMKKSGGGGTGGAGAGRAGTSQASAAEASAVEAAAPGLRR